MPRVLKVGDRGLDFAYQPTTYAKMAQDGACFWCRYSKGIGISDSSLAIRCKPGEITQAVAAGGDFFANFELAEGTPEGGAAAGKANGLKDHDFWPSVGLAAKAGVIISWETSDNKSLYGKVGDFIEAYSTAVGRIAGLYGPLNALTFFRDRGMIDLTWLPMSSQLSGINTAGLSQAEYAKKMEQVGRDNGINLVQNRNRWYGVQADENVITTMWTKPFSHLQAISGGVPVSINGPEKWDDKDWATFMSKFPALQPWDPTHANNPSVATVLQRLSAMRDGDPGHADLPEIVTSVKTILANDVAQTAAIEAIAANSTITPEQLTQIINDAVENAVVDVNVNVHGTPTGGTT